MKLTFIGASHEVTGSCTLLGDCGMEQGGDLVCEAFSQTIYNKLGFTATAPCSGDVYDIVTGECGARGRIVKLSKVSE